MCIFLCGVLCQNTEGFPVTGNSEASGTCENQLICVLYMQCRAISYNLLMDPKPGPSGPLLC